jgi:hypothetical protein
MGQEPEAPAEAPEAEATPESKPSKTFDADYVKQLRAEAARYRTEAQEAKSRVEEFESANQSELEKLTGKLNKEAEARKAAETSLLRFQVAADKQIPSDALDLLTGNTREELEAKADKLLELTQNRNEPTPDPDFDGGAREPAPDPKTPEEQANDTFLGLLGLKPSN